MKRLRAFGRLVRTMARELADENAYQRYLTAHGRTHSGEQWRRFSDERLGAKYLRPRCC